MAIKKNENEIEIKKKRKKYGVHQNLKRLIINTNVSYY